MDSIFFRRCDGEKRKRVPISHIRNSCQSHLKGKKMGYISVLTADHFQVNIMSSVVEHLEK